jgi:CrcB protein
MVPLSRRLPWGTIGINILGSFVIEFFGTLTVAGARYQEAEWLRVFVLVGVCGGFTTFSSFSLQTLDLLRGRAWARAGVNVVLSVLLCLLSVAVGHWAALRLGGTDA